jgi:glycosylphosphatidylinositol transamidase
MPPTILFACALVFQSLVLYYLGTKPITLPYVEVVEKGKETKSMMIPPAYSLQKRHTMYAFSILITTHVTGIIIFNLMQPTFGWKYLSQFTENEVKK